MPLRSAISPGLCGPSGSRRSGRASCTLRSAEPRGDPEDTADIALFRSWSFLSIAPHSRLPAIHRCKPQLDRVCRGSVTAAYADSRSRPCGSSQLTYGPFGHDPGRIDPLLRLVVVPLDLHEVGGVAEAGALVEIPRVAPQVRVVGQPVQVALEVQVVDGVEPGQRREQPDVGLGQLAAEQEPAPAQPLLQRVQRGEQGVERLLVGGLGGRPGRPCRPRCRPCGGSARRARRSPGAGSPGTGRARRAGGSAVNSVSSCTLICGKSLVTIRWVLGVPQQRHRAAAGVAAVGGQVQLGQPVRAGDRVAAAGAVREPPAALAGDRVGQAEPDDPLQAEQPADDQRAVRPRVGQRGVELVAARTRPGSRSTPSQLIRPANVAVLAAETAGHGLPGAGSAPACNPRPLPGAG